MLASDVQRQCDAAARGLTLGAVDDCGACSGVPIANRRPAAHLQMEWLNAPAAQRWMSCPKMDSDLSWCHR
jgi:hypothetical protein